MNTLLRNPLQGHSALLITAALTATSLGMPAMANSPYETAVSCAGGLQFMSTLLPPGSEPAQDAAKRMDAWTKEAERLSRKGLSATRNDLQSAASEAQTVMMSGDQAKIAQFMAPLNDACSVLPKTELVLEKEANPFGLKTVTTLNNFNAAVMCAGHYKLNMKINDEPVDEVRHDGYRAYAKRLFPQIEEEALDSQIDDAAVDYMRELAGMTEDGLNILSLCSKSYENIQ